MSTKSPGGQMTCLAVQCGASIGTSEEDLAAGLAIPLANYSHFLLICTITSGAGTLTLNAETDSQSSMATASNITGAQAAINLGTATPDTAAALEFKSSSCKEYIGFNAVGTTGSVVMDWSLWGFNPSNNAGTGLPDDTDTAAAIDNSLSIA